MMPLLLGVSRSKRKSETWKANTSGNIVRFSIRKSPKPTTGDPMMWYRLMPARFCNSYWRAILIEKQCSIFINRKRSWVFTFPAKRLGSSPPFLWNVEHRGWKEGFICSHQKENLYMFQVEWKRCQNTTLRCIWMAIPQWRFCRQHTAKSTQITAREQIFQKWISQRRSNWNENR